MESAGDAKGAVASSYRWVILGIGAASQASFSCVSQGLPALGPALRTHFGLSLQQVGIAVASILLGMVATQLWWGWAADRFGDRRVVAVGLTSAGVALCACAAAPSFGVLVALLLVCGALGCSTNTATASAVGRWFAADQRGAALGIRQSAAPLGGAVGAIALPALAVGVALGASFLVFGVLLVVTALLAAYWLRPAPSAASERSAPARGKTPLRSAAIWRMTAASSFLIMSQFGLIGFVVVYLHEEQGLSTTAAAGVLAALQVCGAAARILVGRLSDRIGRRITPIRLTACVMAVGFPVLALAAQAGLAALLVALFVVGTAALCWNGLTQVVAIEAAGEGRSGMALGLVNTALALVAGIAPPLFAVFVVHTSWAWAYALLGLPALGALLAVTGMADVRRDDGAVGAPAVALLGQPAVVAETP